MTLRSTLLFLLLAQVVFAEPKLVHAPDAKDPMQVHIYELDNGLTVYLTQNHEEPRF
jgi:predicted Zn-dependent peptidase